MDVTDQMMAYLIGEKEELSVITVVEGEVQDFFNEQDRFHMEEVRDMFLAGLKLRNLLLIIVAVLILILGFRKADLRRLLPSSYFLALGIVAVVLIVFSLLASSDFTKYFTLFHEIFFDNDQWLFDPRTDYMIRMLTEGFFYDFVVRILMIYVGILVGIGILAGLIRRFAKK